MSLNPKRPTPARMLRHARCAGTAMTETVLVAPLVLVILALLFFLGRSMTRLQRTSMVDRYEAWRQVDDAPGPRAIRDDPTNAQLNATFFGGKASRLEVNTEEGFPAAPQAWLIDAAQRSSADTGDYVRRMLDVLPSGQRVIVEAEHEAATPVDRYLAGPIRHGHLRLDGPWLFASGLNRNGPGGSWQPGPPLITPSPIIRDQFLRSLDDAASRLESQGNTLASLLRSLYLEPPRYAGPQLPANW